MAHSRSCTSDLTNIGIWTDLIQNGHFLPYDTRIHQTTQRTVTAIVLWQMKTVTLPWTLKESHKQVRFYKRNDLTRCLGAHAYLNVHVIKTLHAVWKSHWVSGEEEGLVLVLLVWRNKNKLLVLNICVHTCVSEMGYPLLWGILGRKTEERGTEPT